MEEAHGLSDDPVQRADIAAFVGMTFGRWGELGKGESWLRQAVEDAPDVPPTWFELGKLLITQGDIEAGTDALLEALRRGSRNARHYLAAGDALAQMGRDDEALAVWSLGDSLDPMLRQAQNHPQADKVTRSQSAGADTALRKHFSDLHRSTVDAMGNNLDRVRDAIWVQTHDTPFEFENHLQTPEFFYIPDLPAVPVFSGEDIPDAETLEAATPAIRKEFLEASDAGATGAPYVHANTMQGQEWDRLRGQDRWRALHLYKDGRLNEDLAPHFPETLEAIENVPLVKADDAPLEVFFSALKPGTHIPPHHGLANSRLTVHLPLVVPENCGIRVGKDAHTWTEGEVFAFDDSFEHEAWNRAEDDTRVVLIFEAWHPDLSPDEQAAVTASFESRLAWLRSRKIPARG